MNRFLDRLAILILVIGVPGLTGMAGYVIYKILTESPSFFFVCVGAVIFALIMEWASKRLRGRKPHD